MTSPEFLVVGHLNKVHGLKGELFVWPLTDHPEGTFAPGVVVHLGDEQGELPAENGRRLELSSVRPYRRGFLVSFQGFPDRSSAETICGRYLLRPIGELEPLAEGEVFYHDLLGARVLTVDGELVGEIREVYELRPVDMLEVLGKRGTLLIPLSPDVVRELKPGEVVIDPPEGLLDL